MSYSPNATRFPKSRLPLYVNSINWDEYFQDTPPPDVWYDTIFKWSRDQLRAYQDYYFKQRMAQAWENTFYKRLWSNHGLVPADIKGLDDLEKLPMFSSEDVKESIERHPPFGEVCGIDAFEYVKSTPLRLGTSGGTTAMPRPTLYSPLDWEYNGLFIARQLYAQGARPGDRLQIPFTQSLANAGWCAYQACHHYLGIIPITTGSGAVTPSRRQLEYAFYFKTNLWYSMPEYLTLLAKVCETELGRSVKELNTKFLGTYLGPDVDNSFRKHLESLWGCPTYDAYGTHETGGVAFEGPEQDGMYLMEDVGIFEFVDPDTKAVVPAGQAGDIVFTHLHRRVPPLIRYNLRDLGRIKHEGTSPLGSNFRRMDKFLGRSDQMVKIRGTNVYPMACLSAVRSDPRTTGEWLCFAQRFRVDRVLRDELLVKIEVKKEVTGALDDLKELLEKRLRSDLGVGVGIELVAEGVLDTNVGAEGKPRRLVDERGTVKTRSA